MSTKAHRRRSVSTRPKTSDTLPEEAATVTTSSQPITAGKVMEARKGGVCGRCPTPIEPGDQIRFIPPSRKRGARPRPGRTYHEACAQGVDLTGEAWQLIRDIADYEVEDAPAAAQELLDRRQA